MPLGTQYVGEMITTVKNGQMVTTSTAQLVTDYGAGNVFTPSTHFAWPYKGQILHFHKNVSQVIDAALKTTLVAASLGS